LRPPITGRGIHFAVGARTFLMGILNVTPDSFSDGGRFDTLETAVEQARRIELEGADILDVGGESTRPGGNPVDAEQEQARVVPVLTALRDRISIPISIDTYRASTADKALSLGARIVNDVWGFQRDPEIARVAAAHDAPAIAMHNRDKADPGIDIMKDIKEFLSRSVDIALAAGIREDRIVLDPGFGFGKTYAQSLECVARLGELKALGFPVLLGASRKSSIGHVLNAEPDKRLFGSIAVHVLGVANGADIIRAHDIAEHRDALRLADAVRLGLS